MKQSILVVDDSNTARMLLEGLLSEAGYNVLLAESGSSTLVSLKTFLPDLILLDIHLGDLSGLEVCKSIKAQIRTKDIPIILISGMANTSEWAEGLTLGAADCVLKPFNSMELLARIHVQLELTESITARKMAEMELAERNRFIESLMDLSPGIIYIYDIIDRKNIYSNEGIQKVLGYSISEVQEMGDQLLPILMHPDDFPNYIKNVIPKYINAKDNEQIIHQYRMKHKTGVWCWLESTEAIYKRLPDNSPKQIFGTLNDITDRKMGEDALKSLATSFAGLSGKDFFREVSKHIATVANIDCIFIGELDSRKESVVILGGYYLGEWLEMTYPLADTPCEKVMEKSFYFHPKSVQNLFPKDINLVNIKAQSYMGYPILNKQNESIGLMVAIHSKEMTSPAMITTLFNTFIERVAAEMLRAHAEDALKLEKERVETYLNLVEVILVAFDNNANVTLLNRKGHQVLGYEDGELQGKNWFKACLPPEEYESVFKVYKSIISGDIEPFEYYENNIRTKSGQKRWIAWHNSVIKDSNGQIVGTLSSGEDITERKLAEKTLKESEERLRLFFERQLVGMAITSREKGWLKVNSRICEMLGYSHEELSKLTWAELTYADDLEADNIQFNRLLKGEIDDYTLEKRFVRKDGNLVYTNLAVACVRTSDGLVDYVLALVEDITDRKIAENELIIAKEKVEESERTLRAIYENSQDAITITQNGRIVMVNQAFLDLLGFEDKSELIGKSFLDNISPREHDKVKERHQKRSMGLEVSNFYETLGIRKNGEEFPFDVKVGTFEVNNQKFTIAIVRDITDRKKAELELERHRNKLEELVQERTIDLLDTIQRLKETQSQLVQSEKLASLGILTAGIAHEINNPVNYINSSIVSLEILATELIDIIKAYEMVTSENIQEKLKEIEELKESINLPETIEGVTVLSDNIKIGAKKTADIIKSLRTFSRTDSDKPILSNINESIDSTLILLHNQYADRIEIIKNYEKLPLLKCFPGKLNQVFMNLLANAIQAIEGDGTIHIKTMYMPSGFPDFKKECIYISISDSGSGIPFEIRNKVFEPFFTTKDIGKGTGLGLSISYGIIEQHKGKMEFTSEPNNGTEFKLYLPI